jgi:hypothetical protein
MSCSQDVFPVLEGEQRVVAITIARDLDVFSGRMVLQYATSDVTARGVDTSFFNYCLTIGPEERAPIGCGDYEQTSGYVFFEEGVAAGGFEVRIMDDRCYERYEELVQLTLSIPGNGVLQGERVEAMIRIDDDDFGSEHPCRKPNVVDPMTQHPFRADGFWFGV